jgi:diadenosine tetraphosphate (Ap4A) HIT family hydrolase
LELKLIVKEWRSAMNKAFEPDWFNVMQLGNMTKHLHFQLVPRYKKKEYLRKENF